MHQVAASEDLEPFNGCYFPALHRPVQARETADCREVSGASRGAKRRTQERWPRCGLRVGLPRRSAQTVGTDVRRRGRTLEDGVRARPGDLAFATPSPKSLVRPSAVSRPV